MTTELAIQQAQPMMEMVARAVEAGNLEMVKELYAFQRQIDADNAAKAFDGAMHRAQSRMKRIAPNKVNPSTNNSPYADYARVDGAIRGIYQDEGFTLSFNEGESPSDAVVVLCYVTNSGHTRTYKCLMPADGKGAKGGGVMTATHAHGSAFSYGKRYLLGLIFNLVIGKDDDGNAASGKRSVAEMPDQQYAPLMEAIEGANTKAQLFDAYKAAYKAAIDCGDSNAEAAFMKAKDLRKGSVL